MEKTVLSPLLVAVARFILALSMWAGAAIPVLAQAPVPQARKWRLAEDFTVSFTTPTSPDRYGNPDVWQYLENNNPNPGLNPYPHADMAPLTLPHANDSLPGWFNAPETVFVLFNETTKPFNTGTFKWPPGLAGVQPAGDNAAVVGWRSPINGTVHLRGFIQDFEPQNGDGVAFKVKFYDLSANSETTLLADTLPNGGSQYFSKSTDRVDLDEIPVEIGDFLYIVVDGNTTAAFDVTRLDINLDEVLVPTATVRSESVASANADRGQGSLNTVTSGGDPVHFVFGNFTTQVTDLAMPSARSIGGITRSYNSALPEDGPLGWGWSLSYHLSVQEIGTSICDVTRGDGRVDRYVEGPVGVFTGPVGLGDTFARIPLGGGFELTTRDGTSYIFSPAGQLLSATDRSGQVTQLIYTAGRWTGLLEPAGRTWTIAYGKNGKISAITDPAKRTVKYAYDLAGNLAAVADAAGQVTKYEYAEHRLTRITDPRKVVTLTNTYDATGRVTQQAEPRGTHSFQYFTDRTIYTDPLGQDWTTFFDANFQITEREDPNGESAFLSYNAAGLVTTETDARGRATNYSYDAAGRKLTITNADGQTTTFTYDGAGNLATMTEPGARVTTYGYDASQRLITVIDPGNGVTTYSYTAFGLIASITDAEGGLTTCDYDVLGNRTRVTDPLGNATLFTYDAVGNLLTTTDPLGRVKKMTYDKLGRVTAFTNAAKGTTKISYDAVGNVVKSSDALSRSTAFTYNAACDLLSTKDAAKGITTYEYDALSRRTRLTLPDANTYLTTYDAFGRVLTETTPLGRTKTYTYDENGNVRTITDPLGRGITFDYDDLNRLVAIVDALNGQTDFTYDGVGNRLTVTDPLNHTTTFTYDPLNRRTSETNALGHVRTFTYDKMGRLKTATNGEGETVTYTYDLAGRTLSVGDGVETTTYTYNAAGERLTMTDATGLTTYTYDAGGRVATITSPQGVLAFTWDKFGNRTKVAADGGKATSYSYDKLNRLAKVKGEGASSTYFFDQAGRRIAQTFGNKLITRMTYNADSELLSVVTAKGSDPAIFNATYTYDAAGQRTGETSTGAFQAAHQYDLLGRLTQSTITTAVNPRLFTYTYDAAGNRLTAAEDGINRTFTYDAANRIATVNAAPFSYDDAGRLTDDGANTFTYDAFDRLTEVTGLDAADYGFNGDGHLVTETIGAETTDYLIDPTGPLALRVAGTTAGTTVRFVHGSGLIARAEGPKNVVYCHADALGSIRVQTLEDALPLDEMDYAPFGARLNAAGEDGEFSFAGEPFTLGGTLIHLRARNYSPGLGVFLTTDPVESFASLQTGNLYSYVGNDPISRTDPSGEKWPWEYVADAARATAQAAADAARKIAEAGQAAADAARRALDAAGRALSGGSQPPKVKPPGVGPGASLVGLNGSNVVANGGNNVINGNGSTLIGNAGGTLISDKGTGIVGSNAGALISKDGGSIKYSGLNIKCPPSRPFGAGDVTEERKAEIAAILLGGGARGQ